jgi:hypothetical protein
VLDEPENPDYFFYERPRPPLDFGVINLELGEAEGEDTLYMLNQVRDKFGVKYYLRTM